MRKWPSRLISLALDAILLYVVLAMPAATWADAATWVRAILIIGGAVDLLSFYFYTFMADKANRDWWVDPAVDLVDLAIIAVALFRSY